MDPTLRILLPVLRCPQCGASRWSLIDEGDGTATVVCLGCRHRNKYQRGIVWMDVPNEHPDVEQERTAVKPTEIVAALGGWHEQYVDADSIDSDLAAAYLSLPYGNGSPKFAEPGYFANVRRFAPEFDFTADQLPRHGLLLDVGADGTWSTARLAARGLTCVALDITNHLLLGELYHTLFPPYARINADMHAPVFRDESFDIVTAFNALHHSKQLPRVATRIASILKPGGVLALVEPYVKNAKRKWTSVVRRAPSASAKMFIPFLNGMTPFGRLASPW